MNQDISQVLEGWDFDPHELNVRIITGEDGREKLQLRIDLGLLQMALEGRPDGKRPNEFESLLDYYENCAEKYGWGFELSDEAVEDLFRERWQYCQRYLCLFHLGRHDLVIRDTERTLRLGAFVRAHTRRRRDQWRFDQYRPYVILMQTRARAMIALQASEVERALEEIDEGRRHVTAFLQEYHRSADEDACLELGFLDRWYEELLTQGMPPGDLPRVAPDDREELRHKLHKAVEREDYESAALLRDQLKQIEQTETKTG